MEFHKLRRIFHLEASSTRLRVLFLVGIFVFMLPVGWSAFTNASPQAAGTGATNATNVTFVSAQGTFLSGQGAGIYAIDTNTKQVLWSYSGCPKKCYDIDPIDNSTILFNSKVSTAALRKTGESGNYTWKATRMNWRTGKVLQRFSIPPDTHDVDYIGNGKYLVANKVSSKSAERKWLHEAKANGWIDHNRTHSSDQIYIYDAKNDAITWEYDFRKHYPLTAGGKNDYTHLNDVDLVKNGSAILASPRNFDRVVLINRRTKRTEWTLGEEDNYSILDEQHNPELLSTDPPTVLVADSENDRIVEYRKDGKNWVQTWEYRGSLNWPRDADRLPNGNTLIVDSGGDRVLEVTPRKKITWEMDVGRHPYDIERLQYGDEPQGPTMQTILKNNSTAAAIVENGRGGLFTGVRSLWKQYYGLSGWVSPPWMSPWAFAGLNLAFITLIGWLMFEMNRWRRRHHAHTKTK